jgi:hypothetical protein
MSDEERKGKVIEIGPVVRGNTGELGRVVTYEVDGPLGPMPVADWEAVEYGAEGVPNDD